jgi:2-hydroxychromene-2-carboxylate isomerase
VDEIVDAVNTGTFEGTEERSELEKTTDLAVQRGTPGVPAFWLPHERWTDRRGQQRLGRLYWGQDRMQFLEAVLLADGDEQRLALVQKSLRSLELRCAKKDIANDEEVKLEFWYDFSSPWAFLGWTQLARLKRQFGDRLHIEMKPFLLGILFRE